MNETAVQVSNPTTQGDINQAVSLVVQDKLEKAGITDQTLSELKSELQTLSEIDIVDEASFKLVHGGTMKATSARTTITKICKAGREYAIAEQKAWIAAERENIASFSAQEAALKAKKEAWIAQKERVEREALEAQERVIRARFTALEGFGFTRRTAMDGGEDLYINGETTIAVAYVTAADDMVWGNVLKGIEMAWNEEQDRIKAAEEAKAAEAERIRLAQEDIERKQRELKEQQDAFNAKINEARKNELLALGCETWVSDEGDGSYEVELVGVKTTGVHRFAIFSDQLAGFTDAEWLYEKELASNAVSIREKDKADAAREALIASRVKALKEAGWIEAELDGEDALALFVEGVPYKVVAIAELHEAKDYIFNEWVDRGGMELARRKQVEQERIAAEAVERERQRAAMQAKLDEEARIQNEKRAQEAEAQRIAAMGDVEHLDRFYEALSKLGVEMYNQKLTSEMAKHAMKRALPYLDNAMSAIKGVIADLRK